MPALPGPVISAGTQITTQYGTVHVATTTNLTNQGGLVTIAKTGGIQPLDGGSGSGSYVLDSSIYDTVWATLPMTAIPGDHSQKVAP